MLALSRCSGAPCSIQLPKRSRHSCAERQHSGLLAMTLPLHKGYPQAASASLMRRASGNNSARGVRGTAGDGVEQNAVVLVGLERLLLAAFAAEGEPHERNRRIAGVGETKRDYAPGDVVIERRDDLRQLNDGSALHH